MHTLGGRNINKATQMESNSPGVWSRVTTVQSGKKFFATFQKHQERSRSIQ